MKIFKKQSTSLYKKFQNLHNLNLHFSVLETQMIIIDGVSTEKLNKNLLTCLPDSTEIYYSHESINVKDTSSKNMNFKFLSANVFTVDYEWFKNENMFSRYIKGVSSIEVRSELKLWNFNSEVINFWNKFQASHIKLDFENIELTLINWLNEDSMIWAKFV